MEKTILITFFAFFSVPLLADADCPCCDSSRQRVIQEKVIVQKKPQIVIRSTIKESQASEEKAPIKTEFDSLAELQEYFDNTDVKDIDQLRKHRFAVRSSVFLAYHDQDRQMCIKSNYFDWKVHEEANSLDRVFARSYANEKIISISPKKYSLLLQKLQQYSDSKNN